MNNFYSQSDSVYVCIPKYHLHVASHLVAEHLESFEGAVFQILLQFSIVSGSTHFHVVT